MNPQAYQGIAMVVYFAAMIGIGFWAYRRTKNFDDYMLAGRDLGPFATALSAGAADMSGWLLMGLPGALYLHGMVELWIAIGLTIGAWLNWKFVAPRLRTYSEVAHNSITIPSFFGNRLHDKRHLLRVTAGLITLVFFTLYVSSGMVAGGRFFEASFGWNYQLGMLVVAGSVVLYTLVGGFLAVAWTDTVQGLMMVAALVLVPLVGLIHVGGVGSLLDGIREVDLTTIAEGAPRTFELWSPSASASETAVQVALMAWGLGYFGQPHIIVRFMALRTPQEAVAGRRIGIGWMVLACLGAVSTALVGIAVYHRDKGQLHNAEAVFIALGQLLFHPVVAGFMIAAILAAIMSTISSQLLVSSSALVEDLLKVFLRKSDAGRIGILMGRLGVLVVAVAAAWLAWDAERPILDLVGFAWAGFGAAFGPVVLLSLFWRRLTTWGALAGMITGVVVMAIWGNLDGGVFEVYELLPGFLANLGVAVGISMLGTPAPEVDAEFDEAARLVTEFEQGDL